VSDEVNKPEEENLEAAASEATEQAAAEAEAGATDTPAEEAAPLNNDEMVAAAQEEVAKIKEQMLRDQAEMQNVRKRLQGEVDKARKFALEKFSEDLLPIMDNLERAIQSAGDDEASKGVVEGVELTRKSFVDVLAKYNVEQIDPHGEPFDPQLHEAMTMVPNPDMEPNSVMDVFQKGYSLNGRLIRPARVVVSKAP